MTENPTSRAYLCPLPGRIALGLAARQTHETSDPRATDVLGQGEAPPAARWKGGPPNLGMDPSSPPSPSSPTSPCLRGVGSAETSRFAGRGAASKPRGYFGSVMDMDETPSSSSAGLSNVVEERSSQLWLDASEEIVDGDDGSEANEDAPTPTSSDAETTTPRTTSAPAAPQSQSPRSSSEEGLARYSSTGRVMRAIQAHRRRAARAGARSEGSGGAAQKRKPTGGRGLGLARLLKAFVATPRIHRGGAPEISQDDSKRYRGPDQRHKRELEAISAPIKSRKDTKQRSSLIHPRSVFKVRVCVCACVCVLPIRVLVLPLAFCFIPLSPSLTFPLSFLLSSLLLLPSSPKLFVSFKELLGHAHCRDNGVGLLPVYD